MLFAECVGYNIAFFQASHADIPANSKKKGTSYGFVQFSSPGDAKVQIIRGSSWLFHFFFTSGSVRCSKGTEHRWTQDHGSLCQNHRQETGGGAEEEGEAGEEECREEAGEGGGGGGGVETKES